MKVLCTGRGEGKTTRLMAEALDFGKRFPTVLVVHSIQEEERLKNLYRKELLGSKVEVMYFRKLLDLRNKYFKRMLVDNVELIFATIFGPNVDRDGGRLTTMSATGLPMQDLDAARAGAVMLWREAAKMAYDPRGLVDSKKLIEKFDNKAEELVASLPEIWQQRLSPTSDNVTNIK